MASQGTLCVLGNVVTLPGPSDSFCLWPFLYFFFRFWIAKPVCVCVVCAFRKQPVSPRKPFRRLLLRGIPGPWTKGPHVPFDGSILGSPLVLRRPSYCLSLYLLSLQEQLARVPRFFFFSSFTVLAVVSVCAEKTNPLRFLARLLPTKLATPPPFFFFFFFFARRHRIRTWSSRTRRRRRGVRRCRGSRRGTWNNRGSGTAREDSRLLL